MKERPSHDDLLDVITMALDELKIPANRRNRWSEPEQVIQLAAHSKFGGRRR